MLKRLNALAAVCVVMSGITVDAGGVEGQTILPPTKQAARYGLELRVIMPRLTYPRDALVRISIRLTNTSTHVIDVKGNDAPVCGSSTGLGIEVQTTTGHIVFPPAAPWTLASCGPAVFPRTVPPGAVLVDHPLIVLRGSRVRGAVTVGKLGHPTGELRTPAFHVWLTSPDRPPIAFSIKGGTHLVIGPVQQRHAALYYVESGKCLHPGTGGGGWGVATWQRLSPTADGTYRFGMPCDGQVIWAFTGGMLNHSVVREFVY